MGFLLFVGWCYDCTLNSDTSWQHPRNTKGPKESRPVATFTWSLEVLFFTGQTSCYCQREFYPGEEGVIGALNPSTVSRYVPCCLRYSCTGYANCSWERLLELWPLYLLVLSLAQCHNLLTCILSVCLDKCAASFALTHFVQRCYDKSENQRVPGGRCK